MRWGVQGLAFGLTACLLGCGEGGSSGASGGTNRPAPASVEPAVRSTNEAASGTHGTPGKVVSLDEPTMEQLEGLMRARRFPEAWDVATALAKAKPEDEDVHFNAGFVAAELGRTNDAILHYQECVRIVPEYAEAHNNLGNLLRKVGQPTEAIRHLEEAILHAPSNASAHNNLGTTLALSGRVDEAIPHFVQATELRADYTEAWLNLGNAYLQQDRFQDAARPLQRALELGPQHPGVHRAIARLRQKMR